MKEYNSVAVVGAQWGDEGKGKITDFLASRADVIIRWSGGDNAGHTIVFDNKKYKVHLMPSGAFHEEKISVIGNGCVVNPINLVKEFKYLQENGFSCKNVKISDRAHVIFPYHLLMDEYQEESRGDKAIGTTKKGIGPCYVDKADRSGIRVADLLNKELFKEKLEFNVEQKNKIFKLIYNKPEVDANEIYEQYMEALEFLKPHITDTAQLLEDEYMKGSKFLFEGAQGVLLDIDHGTYPFVTSSNPIAGSIPTNTGMATDRVKNAIGVVKAYSTRVGAGAFPTMFDDEVAHYIRETGNEYGTTTGRPRIIGWLDGVILRYARIVGGLTGLSVTLLDVLDNLDEIKICTGYELDGEVINRVPATEEEHARCKPVYEIMPGWKQDTTQCTSFDDLPENAQNYLRKVEEVVGCPVVMFSVGPDREQTIDVKKVF